MTPPQRRRAIKKLARFMGWVPNKFGWTILGPEGAHGLVVGKDWDTFTRINDAMMLVEKIGAVTIIGPIAAKGDDYGVWFDCPKDVKAVYANPLATAITLAALAYIEAQEKP